LNTRAASLAWGAQAAVLRIREQYSALDTCTKQKS
jgi:hypothetical protein